jgi:hypothetical protein
MAMYENCVDKGWRPRGTLGLEEFRWREYRKFAALDDEYQRQLAHYTQRRDTEGQAAETTCDAFVSAIAAGRAPDMKSLGPAAAVGGTKAADLALCSAVAHHSDEPCAAAGASALHCRLQRALVEEIADRALGRKLLADVIHDLCKATGKDAPCEALRDRFAEGRFADCPADPFSRTVCIAFGDRDASKCPREPEAMAKVCSEEAPRAARYAGGLAALEAGSPTDKAVAAAARGAPEACKPLAVELRNACTSAYHGGLPANAPPEPPTVNLPGL